MNKKKKFSDSDFISKEEQFRKLNEQLEARKKSILKSTEELLENHERIKQIPFNSTVKNKLTASIQDPFVRPQTAPDIKLSKLPSEKDAFLINRTIDENRYDDYGDIGGDDDIIASSKQLASETQARILKAKLKATQDELNRRTIELRTKDAGLKSMQCKLKESEESRERLQRMNSIFENQLDRSKKTADGLKEENANLEVQLLASNKELDCLKKSEKQMMNTNSNQDTKVNKLQQECNKYKQMLEKLKVEMRDEKEIDRRIISELSASKKMLEKEKVDLTEVINKQIKLILMSSRENRQVAHGSSQNNIHRRRIVSKETEEIME